MNLANKALVVAWKKFKASIIALGNYTKTPWDADVPKGVSWDNLVIPYAEAWVKNRSASQIITCLGMLLRGCQAILLACTCTIASTSFSQDSQVSTKQELVVQII